MLAIIEGVDGSGKSTLANELRHRLGADVTRIIHRGPLERHPLDEYELDLDYYRPGRSRHVICDRWHLGEAIYGPLYRGVSRLTPEMRLHIELYLMSRGAVMAFMDEPLNVVQGRLRKRGEAFLRPDDLPFVIRRYREVMSESLVVTLRSPGAYDLVQVAIASEKAAEPLASYPSYIGSTSPSLLLLGEKRGRTSSQSEGRHASAFTPFPSASGAYLMKAILTRSILEQLSVGIANAYEENVRSLWEAIGRPEVVTLGRAAAIECLRMGVPYRSVRHPQHVRRFAWSDIEVYAKEIFDGN